MLGKALTSFFFILNRGYDICVLLLSVISRKASEVTQFKVKQGDLYYKGEKVPTTPARLAVSGFTDFLASRGQRVTLVAHNYCFTYDGRLRTAEIKRLNLWERFLEVCGGIADTLKIFRAKLPERVKNKLSFKQEVLAAKFLTPEERQGDAHNAISDVHVLQSLVPKLGITKEDICTAAKPVNYAVLEEQKKTSLSAALENLQKLQDRVSKAMIKKIAEAGISMEMLREAYSRNAEAAVRNLLSVDVGGKPRVTKNTAIVR